MSAAVIILAQRNRYIRIFRQAGAVNEARAIVPSEHGMRDSLIFRGLVRRGILINTDNDRYFLNEDVEATDRKRRLSGVLILLVLILILFLLFFRR